MSIRDQEFTIEKGAEYRDFKVHYPDLLRLKVPKDQALALAQKILRALELAKPDDTHLEEIPLYGEVELLDDE